jgi:hypothetical protein
MNIKDVMDLELGEKSIMIKLDHTGDERHEFDPAVPASVEVAKATFEMYKRKGYVAYRVESTSTDPQGRKGGVMHEFAADARRIIFRPPMQGGR